MIEILIILKIETIYNLSKSIFYAQIDVLHLLISIGVFLFGFLGQRALCISFYLQEAREASIIVIF